jgi:hypothetical protein
VEDLLVKCGKFRLPSQRQSELTWEWKVMMVDVGEMEIERLKKTEALLQWQAKMPQDERTVASGV